MGTVTISRPQGPDGDRIKLEIRDREGRITVEMTPEDFALAITGLGARDCVVVRLPLPGRRVDKPILT